jgi:nitrate reductase gamma subunit
MKKLMATVVVGLLCVAMTLFAMLVLVRATLAVAQMTNPLLRALAVLAELVLGVVLLVGTVYLATRLAVRIFGARPPG